MSLTTVTEQVISELRERILDGKYKPGEHLHESSLASDLNVSRTPIRDALRILGNEDLLVYAPNRGYFVRDVDLKDVLDAYDVRGALEGMACRIVAENGLSEEQQARFAAIVKTGDKLFHGRWGDREQKAWRGLNTEFHFTILETSRNRHLDPILRQVRRFPRMFDARLDPETEFFQNVYTRDQRLRSHHEHIELIQAILNREGTRAEYLMREHVHHNREVLRRVMIGEAADQAELQIKPRANAAE